MTVWQYHSKFNSSRPETTWYIVHYVPYWLCSVAMVLLDQSDSFSRSAWETVPKGSESVRLSKTSPIRSGEGELGESRHRKLRRALLLHLQPLRPLGLGQPAGAEQAEEVEALAHLAGAGQHVVALDQLLPGGRVAAAPQQNLQKTDGQQSRRASNCGS